LKENTKNSKIFDINKCSGVFIQKAFSISREGLRQWVISGCPKNNDNTYSLVSVVQWRENQLLARSVSDERKNVELEKLQNQNRKLELEIETMEKKTISREKHSNIMHTAERELRNYLTESYKRNGQELWLKIREVKDLQGFYEIVDGYNKQAMDAFLEGVKE